MTRLSHIADSVIAEARGMVRKMPGVKVVVLVSCGEDRQLRTTIDSWEPRENWDAVAGLLKATGEEIREKQRGVR